MSQCSFSSSSTWSSVRKTTLAFDDTNRTNICLTDPSNVPLGCGEHVTGKVLGDRGNGPSQCCKIHDHCVRLFLLTNFFNMPAPSSSFCTPRPNALLARPHHNHTSRTLHISRQTFTTYITILLFFQQHWNGHPHCVPLYRTATANPPHHSTPVYRRHDTAPVLPIEHW